MTKSSESISLREASAASKADTVAAARLGPRLGPRLGRVACGVPAATGVRGTYGASRFFGGAFTTDWLGLGLGLLFGLGLGLSLGLGS